MHHSLKFEFCFDIISFNSCKRKFHPHVSNSTVELFLYLGCTISQHYQHVNPSNDKMLYFHEFQCILSDKILLSFAVSLCLTSSGPQPPPCISNRYIFMQNWPRPGTGHQSALCLQPLPHCASCSAACLSGWGLVIELYVALFWPGNLSSFFPLSAPKSWPIYSNLLLKPGWAEW